MPLTPGHQLGPYEITGLLGAGGMGEVYRARDSRLDRSVAIKVLPAQVAADQEALRRLEREARSIASLNHPHICAIHDIGPGYLVLELVEGETLAARLTRGPIPLDQALPLALQLASALDRAHRAGFSHRDIKPANLMLTREGIKVLDFGLARPASTPPPPGDTTATITTETTLAGTPQYMAPELFTGHPAGPLSDIWAFGLVLHEMLTGAKTFAASSHHQLTQAILTADPAPVDPPWLNRILRRCLARNPDQRYQSIRDVILDLEDPAAAPSTPPPSHRFNPLLAVLCLLLAAAAAFLWYRNDSPTPQPLRRFTVDLAPGSAIPDTTASPTPRAGAMAVLSPDESRVAFVAFSETSPRQLFLRRLDQPAATPLPQTENAIGPFFSPDSRWVGFFAEGKLRKVSVDGGAPIDLSPAPSPIGASWANGYIICATQFFGPLSRIPDSGGPPQPLTKLGPGELAHRWPYAIPGSPTFLYAAGSPASFSQANIIAERADNGLRRIVATQGTYPRYANGMLTFFRGNTVFAVPFDPETLQTTGDPIPVLDNVKVARDSGGAQFDITPSGTVLHRLLPTKSARPKIGWLDPDGNFDTLLNLEQTVLHVSLSPDARRFAYRLAEPDRTSIWVKDIAGGQSRRLSFEPGRHGPPLWSPDSQSVSYGTLAGIFSIRADGSNTPTRILPRGEPVWWTPNGKTLGVASQPADPERKPCRSFTFGAVAPPPERPCFDNPSALQPAWASSLSPDGRWMAYATGFTAAEQVFVTAYPSGKGAWQISTKGGVMAQWSGDGKRIFFVGGDDLLYSSRITISGDAITVEEPRRWSQTARPISFGFGYTYSPNFDGSRILTYSDPDSDSSDARVELIENFTRNLRP